MDLNQNKINNWTRKTVTGDETKSEHVLTLKALGTENLIRIEEIVDSNHEDQCRFSHLKVKNTEILSNRCVLFNVFDCYRVPRNNQAK